MTISIKNIKKIFLILKIKTFSYLQLYYTIKYLFKEIKKKRIQLKFLPKKYCLLTILKSPHVYKKTQEHLLLKIFSIEIQIPILYASTLFFLISNKPYGLFFKIIIKKHLNL